MFTTWVLQYDPNRTSTTDCSLIGTILPTCTSIDRKRSNICESLLTIYFISLMRCEKGFSTVLGCLGTSWSIKHVLSEQPGGRFITLLLGKVTAQHLCWPDRDIESKQSISQQCFVCKTSIDVEILCLERPGKEYKFS